MAINRQKISQMTPKGSDLDATDLLEVSVDTGSGYETRSITGAEVFGGVSGTYVPYTGATQDVDLGEFELKAGQLTLDTSPTGTAAVGTTRWNNTLGSSETTLKGGSVILKNGVDLVARVVNKVTPNATLTKAAYQAVRVSGAQGQRLAVAYAQANNDNNSADTIGLVTETIATNQEGFIITVGQLEEINTTGSLQGETWSDGDVLYLSSVTPGAITNVKPTAATAHIVVIGYVEYAHVNHGKIYVKIMNGWELDELHNVYINTGTLANNDALIYESSTQLWKNKTIATALGYTPAPRDVTIDTKTIQYTLVTGDNSKFIELNFSGGNNIIIPTNTAQPFPIGAQIILSQYGAGQVTVVPDTGVTLRSSGGKTKTAAQYAMATLIKRGTNEWYLAGDLTT
jgi:nitrogen fixation protein